MGGATPRGAAVCIEAGSGIPGPSTVVRETVPAFQGADQRGVQDNRHERGEKGRRGSSSRACMNRIGLVSISLRAPPVIVS